jgi:HNH endonuclease
MAEKNCSIDGCAGEHRAKGYCFKHYMQSKRGNLKSDATVCAHCGGSFKAGNSMAMYCSKACKLAAWKINKPEMHRVSMMVHSLRRRDFLAGASVGYIDPFKVFDRDGWRCQLCGIKTPRNRRGTHYHNAPELDHILPVSKGGWHSYMNTQCACKQCNMKKNNKPRGQMQMFECA